MEKSLVSVHNWSKNDVQIFDRGSGFKIIKQNVSGGSDFQSCISSNLKFRSVNESIFKKNETQASLLTLIF